jgi:hypothetical protein
MYVQVEKNKECKSRAVANSVTQKKNTDIHGHVNNRSEAIAQRHFNQVVQKTKSETFGGVEVDLDNPDQVLRCLNELPAPHDLELAKSYLLYINTTKEGYLILGELVAQKALKMTGHLEWAGPTGINAANGELESTGKRNLPRTEDKYAERSEVVTNDYALWLQGKTPASNVSKMNCWQAALFTIYTSGIINKEFLISLHKDAISRIPTRVKHRPLAAQHYNNQLYKLLSKGKAQWDGISNIPAGHLVFFLALIMLPYH